MVDEQEYWSFMIGEGDVSWAEDFERWFRAFHGADYNRSEQLKLAAQFWLMLNQWARDSRYDPPQDVEERYRWLANVTRQALIDREGREFDE